MMSDRDSGVDSAGEDSFEPSNQNQNLNRDDEMNEDDVDDYVNDHVSDGAINNNNNDNQIQLPLETNENSNASPKNPFVFHKKIEILFQSNSINLNKILTNDLRTCSQEEAMMSMPSTSRQSQLEMFITPSPTPTPSSSPSPSSSFLNNATPMTNDATHNKNLLKMKALTISEIKDSTPLEKFNAQISNSCGFNLKQKDSNLILEFYQKNNQHNFIPKMMNSRMSRLQRKSQYGVNQHEERMLRNAVNNGDIHMVRRLMFSGRINVNSYDERRRTALHLAAVRGYNDIALILLVNGANPNVRDVVGNTPLHLAVCSSKLDMVILLLKNGANCTSSDNSGRTPIQLARSKLLFISKLFGRRSPSDIPEAIKMEAMKISLMLEIYFDKCRIEKRMNDMNLLRNRLETSQSTQEIEKDVNNLLKSLEDLNL